VTDGGRSALHPSDARPSLAQILSTRSDSLAILDALRRALVDIGPVEEHLTRSQVVFERSRPVTWAWVPGQYLGGRGSPLVMSIALPSRDPSPRWKEVVEVRPGRHMHHLELWAGEDVDAEVVGWLRLAWEAAGAG
jgi:hypothetical protein